MWKKVSYKFSEFDIFGEQVSLKLNGDQHFKTACGGLTTSVVVALCAAFFVIEFSSFIKLQNINVFSYQEFNPAPLLINLNSEKFMFAVSVEQTATAYNQNPFFSIVMTVYNQTRYNNGTVVKTSQTSPLVPCTLAHWENLGGTFNWTQSFYSLQLGTWLCPSLDSDIILQGAFDSTFFDYVRFTVVPCNPQTTQNCATDQQRAAYLQANNAFSFQFYTSNFVINAQNVTYYDTYLLSMLYWYFIPNVTYVEANVFMQEYDITTDTSLMPWTQEEEVRLPVLDSFEVQTFVYSPVIPSTVQAKIFLRRSYFSQIYQRQYQKFQTLISQIGGFVQALIILFGIFISAYNHKKPMIYLANKLYDFELDEQQDKENNEKFQHEIQNIQEHYQKRSQNIQQDILDSQVPLQQNEQNKYTNNNDEKISKIEKKLPLDQNLEYNELSQSDITPKEQIDQQNAQQKQNIQGKKIVQKKRSRQSASSIAENKKSFKDLEQNSSERSLPEFERKNADMRIYDQENTEREKAMEVYKEELANVQPTAEIKINSRSIKLKSLSDDEQSNKKSDQSASNEQSQNIDDEQLQSPMDQKQVYQQKLSMGQSQQHTAPQIISKQTDTENVNQKELKQKFTDWRTFLKQNIDQIILRQRQQLEMTFEYFVFVLTCGKFMRTNRNMMIDKSTERVEAQLDLYTILEKLQQFDKMQKLLLNQEQRVLFNFCPKEIIQPSDEDIVLGRKKLRQLVIKGYQKGQDSDKKQPKKRMMSVIASSVNKFWQAGNNSKNKISTETQDIFERGRGTASFSESEFTKQPEDQSMQFFVHLYQAYDKVSRKAKQQQEGSVQDQGLSVRQSILKDHLQSNLPQIVKETVQLDVNERLMGLLGKEMYQIMYTAQLLKDDPEILMWKKFSYKVSEFDIFGEQVSLKLNGDQYFKTACGGLTTSVVMALCAVFFVIEFNSFIQLQNITVVQYQEFDAAPLLLNLTSNKFMFAVSIEQTTAYNQNPLFSIVMTVYNQTRYDNGTAVKVSKTAPLAPCTLAHWENLGGSYNWTKSFYSLQLSSWLCPSLDSDIILQGAFDSTFFDYVRFTVVPCNPKTTQNCASDSQRAAYLQANNAFSFQFYTSNFVINPDNVVPYDTYLLSMLYWDFIPNVTYVEANVFMQEYDITTDTSLMPWTNEEEVRLPVLDSFEIQTFVYTPVIPNTVYAKIFLRRSYFSQIYERQFQKFQDLISYVGGFVQALIILFGIFLSIYNQKKLMIYLANKLYDFELDEQQDKENNEKFQREIQNIQEYYQKRSQNIQQDVLDSQAPLHQNEQNFYSNNNDEKISKIEKKLSLHQNLENNEQYSDSSPKEQIGQQNAKKQNIKRKNRVQKIRQRQFADSVVENKKSWKDLELNSSERRVTEIERMNAQTRIENTRIDNTIQVQQQEKATVQNGDFETFEPTIKQDTVNQTMELKTIGGEKKLTKNRSQLIINKQLQNLNESIQKGHLEQEEKSFQKNPANKNQVHCELQVIQKQEDGGQQEPKQAFTDRRGFLRHHFEHIILRRRQQLQMTWEYFIFFMTCGKFMRTKRNQMIDKSIERVEAQLDLSIILEKIQQIEKMQKLLLNQEQRVLFNFCPKEVLQPSDENIVLGRKKLRSLFLKGIKNGQNADTKQPSKLISIIASGVDKFWEKNSSSKNKDGTRTQEAGEVEDAAAGNAVDQKKQLEEQSMQFFIHLYEAYDKVSRKAKQQEGSAQQQVLRVRQTRQAEQLQTNLPQLVKETMQLDVNERLMALLGKEMYQIMNTAQLLKDDSIPADNLMQSAKNSGKSIWKLYVEKLRRDKQQNMLQNTQPILLTKHTAIEINSESRSRQSQRIFQLQDENAKQQIQYLKQKEKATPQHLNVTSTENNLLPSDISALLQGQNCQSDVSQYDNKMKENIQEGVSPNHSAKNSEEDGVYENDKSQDSHISQFNFLQINSDRQ